MYPEKYLSENATALDINDNDDFSSLAMLDSVRDQYRVFLTGEWHYQEGNFEVKWKILRYMHARAGIKNLVLESSPAFGWLLTHYLRERDEENYLQIISMSPQGAKERVFYRSIYKYFSETLPDDSLRIIGIDGEFVPYLTFRALDEMAEKGNRRLKNVSRVPVDMVLFKNRKITADSLLGIIQKNDSLYRDFFKEDFSVFMRIIRGVACNCYPPSERKSTDPRWAKREEYMFQNFLEVLREFPDEKFYGQFGARHVNLKPNSDWYKWANWSSFASRLNSYEISPVKGRVCSIVLSYNFVYNAKEWKPYFRQAAGNNWFTLFRLDRPGSPFRDLSEKTQFTIFLRYFEEQEIKYNRTNDRYQIMDEEEFGESGFAISYQTWEDDFISFGLESRNRPMKELNYNSAFGLYFENNLNKKLHKYKTGFWAGGAFTIGIHFSYLTNYSYGAWYFEPAIGVSREIFSISFVRNMKLRDKHALPGISRNLVCFSLFLPTAKH